MALDWDCSPAKSCNDVGMARYTMDAQSAESTKTRDDDAMQLPVQRSARTWSPSWFGRKQKSAAGDRSNSPIEGMSPQDVCSYPAAAFGPPFAPPRYCIRFTVVSLN